MHYIPYNYIFIIIYFIYFIYDYNFFSFQFFFIVGFDWSYCICTRLLESFWTYILGWIFPVNIFFIFWLNFIAIFFWNCYYPEIDYYILHPAFTYLFWLSFYKKVLLLFFFCYWLTVNKISFICTILSFRWNKMIFISDIKLILWYFFAEYIKYYHSHVTIHSKWN